MQNANGCSNMNHLTAFNRLAPFIQEYIYNQGWADLRQVQVEACHVIFDTDAHLLIAAGTAAGKTEAAFLPVVTQLYEQQPASVGAMYIGPIKALINDQFERLDDLLREAAIPVWPWHGDIVQSRKKKLLKDPRGILQITPESLESLLINKYAELPRLFGELQFVIIDEIHAFMGTERGDQVLCQLTRLARLAGCEPRRIGLSATLGDYGQAEDWLRAGTNRSVATPDVQAAERKVRLSLEHFYWPEQVGAIAEERDIDSGVRVEDGKTRYYDYLFDLSQGRRCLIFASNRTETETAIAQLRRTAKRQGQPDIYHVHHGSVSAHLRETAEDVMRSSNTPAVTAATLTLEMGIDIGKLDRVIQLESPASVASFLQRLGRTGRRGSPADMRFLCAETKPLTTEHEGDFSVLTRRIPWQLLQCIAAIQLYLEERWIEPFQPAKYPFSLLYHQTMSTLVSMGELTPADLAQQVLTLPSFSSISADDYRRLLHHLIAIEHIQQTEQGNLIVGFDGTRIVSNYRFYAIFQGTEDYRVRDGNQDIGSIALPPSPGECFALAGRTWEVLEIDPKRRLVSVQPGTGHAGSTSWRGGSSTIHTRVLQRMRQVLLEETDYPYLQPGARERLQEARQLAQIIDIAGTVVFPTENQTCCIFPWMGTAAFRTLERFLAYQCKPALELKWIRNRSPYFFTIHLGKSDLESLTCEVKSVRDRRLHPEELLGEEEAPELRKYDEFVPADLRRKAFAADYLDLQELSDIVSHW